MQSRVPLIDSRYIFDNDTSTENSVVIYDESMEFIAFSHVWKDGIRSTSEAGLPSCQLRRLCAALEISKEKNVRHSPLFWIDGLCIPEEKVLQHRAIDSMAYIYKVLRQLLSLTPL